MLIVLSGTIGAGKTSLTKILSDHLNSEPYFEPVGNNEVLPLFYKDPARYGFLLQIYFLNKRFDSMKRAMKNDNNILDRSIYEDALFTDLNTEMGRITKQESEVYHDLLDNMLEELPYAAHKKRPDLMIHIRVSLETQIKRIEQRGREYEQLSADDTLLDYYKLLHAKYEDWFAAYDASPKLLIDGDKLDFMNSDTDKQAVIDIVDTKLKAIEGDVIA